MHGMRTRFLSKDDSAVTRVVAVIAKMTSTRFWLMPALDVSAVAQAARSFLKALEEPDRL